MDIDTFDKFWLHYLHEHGRRETRALHIAGTGVAMVLLAAAAASLAAEPRQRRVSPMALAGLAALAGYGPAWAGHFLVEKNRPATFRHPLWSLLADLRMAWLWATGGLDRHLRIAGVENDVVDAASMPDSRCLKS
jgi:hypothetical protein